MAPNGNMNLKSHSRLLNNSTLISSTKKATPKRKEKQQIKEICCFFLCIVMLSRDGIKKPRKSGVIFLSAK